MRINRKELWAAALLLFLGMATVIGSNNYQIGTLARMGPGYFPLMLGVILMILGFLILFSPNLDANEVADDLDRLPRAEQLKTWALVIGAVIAFVLVGKYGGLVPATFIMTTMAALADKGNSFKVSVVVGTVLTVATIIVFHFGLQMQFPLFTWG